MKELQLTVLSNQLIAKNIYEMQFALPNDLCIKSGQFLSITTGSKQHLLRRPFAIASIEKDVFSICYQLKGSGTQSLQEVKVGETLNAVLPLGNYFLVDNGYKKVAVIGGGVGIFPLLAFAKEYEKNLQIHSYIGFRSADYRCKVDDFQACTKTTFTTDDGSFGVKGNVIEAFLKDFEKENFDAVYACGPTSMLRALKESFKANSIKIPCFVSLEERMGCGIGACLVCVCKGENADTNFRVCKDGPVFKMDKVVL